MLCENCQKRDAKVHVSKIINGKKEEMYLCEECAQINNSIDFAIDFSFNNFLTSLLNKQFESPHKIDSSKKELVCDLCKMDYYNFAQNGRLGCSRCYNQFQEKVDKVLRKIHGTNLHTGKIPKRNGQKVKLKRKIKKLKEEMDSVVAREEFEKAAVIRDQIKRIKSDIGE